MTSAFGTMLLIANPAAGRGRGAVLPRLQRALDARQLAFEVATTRGRGHATELAHEAVDRGLRFVVAVGGDGTIHEVVNGLVDAKTGPRAEGLVLGAVPAGSGSDFVRTFGLDRSPEMLARHLDGDTVYPIDIGQVSLTGLDGATRHLCFANIAEVGYGATVVARAERLPRWLGRLRYLAGLATALRKSQTSPAVVTLDHTTVDRPVTAVIVANGQFFGGNMKVAPRALPDDGKFNVQVWDGSVAEIVRMMPRIMKGEHTDAERVSEWQSKRVTVETSEPMLVEADGELLGRTPATFDLYPRALSFKI